MICGVRYKSYGPCIYTSKSLSEVQFVISYVGHLLWNMSCAFSLRISEFRLRRFWIKTYVCPHGSFIYQYQDKHEHIFCDRTITPSYHSRKRCQFSYGCLPTVWIMGMLSSLTWALLPPSEVPLTSPDPRSPFLTWGLSHCCGFDGSLARVNGLGSLLTAPTNKNLIQRWQDVSEMNRQRSFMVFGFFFFFKTTI